MSTSSVKVAVDVAALEGWIQSHVEGAGPIRTISQYTAGKANLTYLISFEHGSIDEIVMRRPPVGHLPKGGHDMAREHYVLERLWRAFPLAPRCVAYCGDPSIIGAPFLLMEKKHGVVIQDVVPEIFGSGNDPTTNHQISTTVVETLARLHAVDPSSVDLDQLGWPIGFLERQVAGWTKRILDTEFGEPDAIASIHDWLMEDVPEPQKVSILHNDWRLDNIALSPDNPSLCTAVYDWDMCTRGDPLADLGTLMATWYEPNERVIGFAPMPTGLPGFLSAAESVAEYERVSGVSTDRIGWYVVFGTLKIAAILQQLFARWRQGQSVDDRFAKFDVAASQLVALAQARRRNASVD